MDTTDRKGKRTHHGHAVKRLRQTLGIKQGALATDLGLSQQAISTYEQKKEIEHEMLQRFAKVLHVSVELIRDLEEDPVTIIIENNTFEKGSIANVVGNNTNNYNNPIEQIIELNKEKQALYERMLELEKEKNSWLQKFLREHKY